jgi:aconitate decarboxylase
MTVSEAFAAHAARTRLEDLPAGVVEAATGMIVDTLGVGIAGTATPETRSLIDVASRWGSDPEARVWGAGARLPAPSVALVVSHAVHCLEFDAIHEPAVVHPMTVVLPALLADTERRLAAGEEVAGADLLSAVAVGVDIAGGLGDVTTTALRFFRPATAGIMGAVAAIGNARHLPAETIADGLGIAYGQLSGTMQPHTECSSLLALQVGFNARGAVCAMDLAMAGHIGPREVFEGRFGYFGLIEEGGKPDALFARLGSQWEVARTSYKPFPSGRATHSAIDGALRLRERHGIDPRRVERVHVSVPPMIHHLVARPLPDDPTPNYLRLSLSFQVACALVDGRVDLDTSRPQRLADPDVRRLAGAVEVEVDDNPDSNAFDPQTVTIWMDDGTHHRITLPRVLGSPEESLSRERRLAKLADCLRYGAPHWGEERMAALVEATEALATGGDAAAVVEAL